MRICYKSLCFLPFSTCNMCARVRVCACVRVHVRACIFCNIVTYYIYIYINKAITFVKNALQSLLQNCVHVFCNIPQIQPKTRFFLPYFSHLERKYFHLFL